MTHFFEGNADFTPLKAWIRERNIFNSAMKIPFFKKYRIWKGFGVWKKNIRVSKMIESRQVLVKNLFVLDPVLRASLLELRTSCLEVAGKRMIDIAANKTYNLTEFLQEQQTWYESTIKSYLLDFEQLTREQIDATCQDSLNRTGLTISIRTQGSARSRSARSHSNASSKNNSKRLTYTEQAAKRNACRRLQRFVKLSDYLMVTALHSLATNSMHDLSFTLLIL